MKLKTLKRYASFDNIKYNYNLVKKKCQIKIYLAFFIYKLNNLSND